MIVIVNGPPGIGKSTIARKLSKKLKNAVVIEVDRIKFGAIDPRKDTTSLDIGDQQVFTIAKALRHSKDCIILDYTYHSRRHFRAVVALMKKFEPNIFAYSLRASYQENRHRDERRPPALRLGDKVHEYADRFDALGDEVGYTVESTGLSVEKTAAKIHHLLLAGIGRF